MARAGSAEGPGAGFVHERRDGEEAGLARLGPYGASVSSVSALADKGLQPGARASAPAGTCWGTCFTALPRHSAALPSAPRPWVSWLRDAPPGLPAAAQLKGSGGPGPTALVTRHAGAGASRVRPRRAWVAPCRRCEPGRRNLDIRRASAKDYGVSLRRVRGLGAGRPRALRGRGASGRIVGRRLLRDGGRSAAVGPPLPGPQFAGRGAAGAGVRRPGGRRRRAGAESFGGLGGRRVEGRSRARRETGGQRWTRARGVRP